EKVRDMGDEFMFGPDLLVAPVTEEGAAKRDVYLPAAAGWYEFWTGAKIEGGKKITADAPLDRIPLFVKAGSILPLGPEVEYATEQPDAPITLRIYRGADADFTLYEDEGDTYDYEKGAHATIPLHWDEATSTLSIGARQGQYPGMPATRTFQVVLVDETHGTGSQLQNDTGRTVQYGGSALKEEMK